MARFGLTVGISAAIFVFLIVASYSSATTIRHHSTYFPAGSLRSTPEADAMYDEFYSSALEGMMMPSEPLDHGTGATFPLAPDVGGKLELTVGGVRCVADIPAGATEAETLDAINTAIVGAGATGIAADNGSGQISFLTSSGGSPLRVSVAASKVAAAVGLATPAQPSLLFPPAGAPRHDQEYRAIISRDSEYVMAIRVFHTPGGYADVVANKVDLRPEGKSETVTHHLVGNEWGDIVHNLIDSGLYDHKPPARFRGDCVDWVIESREALDGKSPRTDLLSLSCTEDPKVTALQDAFLRAAGWQAY
jgi:hypothetical protein